MAFEDYNLIEDVKFDESQYLKTGIIDLDKAICGIGLGQLTIMTGTRASGKTTLLGNIINNFIDNGYDGLLCSFEMSNPRLKRWLNIQALGKDNIVSKTSFTGKEIFEPKSSFVNDKVSKWIGKHLRVYDNSSFEITKVSKDIKAELERNPNIKFVILDNLMKIDTENMNDNKYEAQSILVKRLQVFAQKRNIALILVVHPTKIRELPRLEDVGGSGDILNASDLVLIVHRVTTDFKIRAEDYFGWNEGDKFFKYSNLIEIAKDRDFGNDNKMVGLYFEECSKRFLNWQGEKVVYGWDKESKQAELIPIEDDGTLPY